MRQEEWYWNEDGVESETNVVWSISTWGKFLIGHEKRSIHTTVADPDCRNDATILQNETALN